MPQGIEDYTEALQNENGTSCYFIIRQGHAEKFYDRKGLLSRLNKYGPKYFQLQVYKVNLNEHPAIRLLEKTEVRKLHQALNKAKGLTRQLLELGDIIDLPE
jgi:hypothetical protein